MAATPETLITMLQTADGLFGPEDYRCSVIGLGYPTEVNMAVMGIIMGRHISVGLEDYIFVRRGVLATNVDYVEKVKRLAAEFEREIAAPDKARQMLGLKRLEAVNF